MHWYWGGDNDGWNAEAVIQFWSKKMVFIFGKMSRQSFDERAAVIAETREIMESAFGIVTDFHGAKLVFLGVDLRV